MREKKEKSKQKKNIWPGTIVLALITSIVIYAVMINSEKNALADYEKGSVYVITQDIPKGTLIREDNYPEYFALKEIDKKLVPEKAISTAEQIQNLVASCSIDKGALATLSMFESVNDITKEMKEPVIASFKADDLYQVVGGTLRAGDRIHIYNADEEGIVTLNWSDVYVQQVFDNTGTNIPNDNETSAAQRINVYMDKEDIGEFYTKLATGTLRVVKACD